MCLIERRSGVCEFCARHGDGDKWYLNARNYVPELLHEELGENAQELAGARTRVEWLEELYGDFVAPAIMGVAAPADTEGPSDVPDEERLAARKAVHFGQVIPIEDVEQVLDRAQSITRLPCGCRFASTGKVDMPYCFGLGLEETGLPEKHPEASASLEKLSKEKALEIIREYDAEGLFHTVWTAVTPYVIAVCNCDRDCLPFRHYVERRGLPSFFRGEYVGEVDADRCTGCKLCMSQCQFGAAFYSSTRGEVDIDPALCFGCGVCRSACPTEAIRLVSREEREPAAGVW